MKYKDITEQYTSKNKYQINPKRNRSSGIIRTSNWRENKYYT